MLRFFSCHVEKEAVVPRPGGPVATDCLKDEESAISGLLPVYFGSLTGTSPWLVSVIRQTIRSGYYYFKKIRRDDNNCQKKRS